MKKTLTLVGLGASVLLAFPSCKSTDSDGFFGDTEEAVPMSFVGDDEAAPWEDEMPPWMMQDNSNGAQASAGETTLIPAPDEPVADNGGSVSTSQNRPDVAVNNDVVVENDFPFAETDPLSGAPVSNVTTTPSTTTPAAATTTPKKTTSTGKKTGTSKTGGKKTATTKKPSKKLSKPTLVVYKVRPGDNLSTIAKRSNTTVAQIRKDSGIKGDIIHPGQTIKVRYTPKDYKAPAKNTSKNSGKNNKTTSTAKNNKGAGSYTVRSGETISGIAKKNGVSTAALLKANGMTNADAAKMRPGKKLIIPKK